MGRAFFFFLCTLLYFTLLYFTILYYTMNAEKRAIRWSAIRIVMSFVPSLGYLTFFWGAFTANPHLIRGGLFGGVVGGSVSALVANKKEEKADKDWEAYKKEYGTKGKP